MNMNNLLSGVLPVVTNVVTCDHDVIRSKTLGKLLNKCAGCDSRKKWPWTKMAKCRHCKKFWHQQCVPSQTLSSAEDVGCESPVISTMTEAACYLCVGTSVAPKSEMSTKNLPSVDDTVPEETACSVPVVKTTDGVRYSGVGTSVAPKTEMSIKNLPSVGDTVSEETACSVPVVKTTDGVRYSGVGTSVAPKTEMLEILPTIAVTGQNSVLPPDTEEVKENTEILPVVDSSNVTNEVEERKEILDFIKYVATTLTMTNLKLIDVKVLKLRITSTALLEELTELIVQQALVRKKYTLQYAMLCAEMVQDEAFNATPRDSDKTFEDVLVQKCRKMFCLLSGNVSKTIWINKKKLSVFFVFVKLLYQEGALSHDVAQSFVL